MKSLTAHSFFQLKDYIASSLFDQITYVWEALENIESFLQKQNLGKIECEIPDGVFLKDIEKISIGKGTVVEPGAYIQGPCFIGENCQIRQGAYIRGNVVTGNNCVIGHCSEIKNSIFLNKAQAPHFAYVGDSILGNNTNLGAGTVCSNLKLTKSEVIVHFQGEKISTKRRKFGAILGDGAQTGCNTVLNPGTILFCGSCTYPNTTVGGVVPENHIVKSASKSRIIPMKR